MADFATALADRLMADAAVAAAVGTKVHWIEVPQATVLPYIRLQLPTNFDEQTLKGGDGTRFARVQVDCFGLSFKSSWQLARKVRDALLFPATIDGVVFGGAQIDGPVPEQGQPSPNGVIYWNRIDAALRYREP